MYYKKLYSISIVEESTEPTIRELFEISFKSASNEIATFAL